MDITKYQLPLGVLPKHCLDVIDKEVEVVDFPNFNETQKILNRPFNDGIYKNNENSFLLKCTTQMEKVTPKMIDWWFAWHLPFSERYKLWHPKDHISAKISKDRSTSNNDKENYIGIDSLVEEYIGKKIFKLKISFIEPRNFGITSVDDHATAVCALVTDRTTGIQIARLIHYVRKVEFGSIMTSLFWMGSHVSHPNPIKNSFIRNLLKVRFIKHLLLNEYSARSLLIHCYEEMNHLQKFLPCIYEEFGGHSRN